MKNLIKKTVCLMLSFALIILAVVYVAADENSDRTIVRNESFIYEILPNGTITLHCYVGKDSVVSVPQYIGDYPVRRIAPLCFSTTAVESVSVAYGIESVDSEAFAYCSELQTVYLPKSIKSYGAGVFRCCPKLQTVLLDSNIPRLGEYMFYGCVNLSNVEIPNGIAYIPTGAFAYCYNLKEVVLRENLYLIYPYAFFGSGLERISFPSSLEYIDDYAFAQTSDLTNVDFSKTFGCAVSATAFENSGYIHLPDAPPEATPDESPDKPPTSGDETEGTTSSGSAVPEDTTPRPPYNPPGDETNPPYWEEETTPPIEDETAAPPVSPDNDSSDLIKNYIPGSNFAFLSDNGFVANENSVSQSANLAAQNKRNDFASLAWDVRSVGDSNCDNTVNIKDATNIQKYAAEIITDSHPEFNYKNSDVNTDGRVNVKDATKIQKFCAGIISILY